MNEPFAERIGVRRARRERDRRHHSPVIEVELGPLAASLQIEDTGLALLSDQLEDVGDAEVAEVSRESDAHARLLRRAASDRPDTVA
jgi:hypothetical protein